MGSTSTNDFLVQNSREREPAVDRSSHLQATRVGPLAVCLMILT